MAFSDTRAQTHEGERHSPVEEFRRRQLDAADDDVAHLDTSEREPTATEATAADHPAAPPRAKWWLKRWENRYQPWNHSVDRR